MSNADKIKLEKAKIILSQEHAIKKINSGLYTVSSQTGIGTYRVEWNGKEWICNCPDHIKYGHMRECKHVLALLLYKDYHSMIEHIEQPEKVKRITYSQRWADYNHAQSRELELFDQFLYQLTSTIENPEQKGRGRKRHKRSDLVFCSIMKVYSQLSSRRSQCLFHQALERQQIDKNIHYNALSRALLNPELTPILRGLLQASAEPLASVEIIFAVDSSGFRCSTFGSYCIEKHKTRRRQNWLKVHISNGVHTNIVADAVVTNEYAGDSPQLVKLLRGTAKHFAISEVLADKAYSSRKNHEIIGQYGGTPYIMFKADAKGRKNGSVMWYRAYHYFKYHNEEFLEHYHKRSNVETTFHAIKRKFGESLKSKDPTAQINEMYCKLIAYNITVLIHEMIELDPQSEILFLTGMKKEISISSQDN